MIVLHKGSVQRQGPGTSRRDTQAGAVLSPFLEEGIHFEAKEERKTEVTEETGGEEGNQGRLCQRLPHASPL